jgi:putative hemolysin
MTSGNWFELIIAAFALVVVFISAWVETSLQSVTRGNLRALIEESLARSAGREVEPEQNTRSSLLLVEMVAIGVATALLGHVGWDAYDYTGLWLGILVATILHIIFGRILPRIMVGEERSDVPTGVTRTAQFLTLIFSPIIKPVDLVANAFTRKRVERLEASREEEPAYENNWSNGNGDDEHDDEIEPEEQEMISGVLNLESVTVSQIMVPRIDVVGIRHDATIAEATEVAITAGHSRIPVYGMTIDEVLGIVYAKDLLKYVVDDPEGVTIDTMMRPAYFVPESKRVDDLLSELQRSRVHMAVVVDEYGGTAGVVTIEDILEEIVGEIADEFDIEEPYIEVLNDSEAIVAGRVSVDDMLHDLDLELPVVPPGTVGGFVQRELARVPREGDEVTTGNIRIEVLEVDHRRVKRVKVVKLDEIGHEDLETAGAA